MNKDKSTILVLKTQDLQNEIQRLTILSAENPNLEKFDNIQVEELKENLTPEIFHSLKQLINDGGQLTLFFDDNFKNEDNSIMKNVSSMKFAGYIDTKIEKVENNFKLTGKKRKTHKDKKIENPWKNINLEVKSDLVLEDELDDPFDTYQKFSKKTDCVTKPKPCKNCNCGRAQKEGPDNSGVVVETSSCGRCYLGDAFRCAGCPYKGKPAFEPGEKIDFTNINSTNNSNSNVESEEVNIKLDSSKKVKIEI